LLSKHPGLAALAVAATLDKVLAADGFAFAFFQLPLPEYRPGRRRELHRVI
jgi:hypothetical protein